jgi:eukaryotic-like serine/threonine-protein kinase
MDRLGKYELVRRLNSGGMAELYLARQPGPRGFEKTVVIKRLLPNLIGDAALVRMFLNEARIAARLSHPNIVQIFDLGSVGKEYFLAMEYVEGRDLGEVQERAGRVGKPMPQSIAAYVGVRLCAALAHAHNLSDAVGRRLGIVHRDVSPQNILVSYEGEVKLADFGIAKATALAAETQAGLLQGKRGYMSPEQCRNEPVDARSDIFAVGIVLYELACRRRLFRRNTELATMRAVLDDPIPPPSAVVDDVPDELEAVIMRALARSPEERYADAQLLELDLSQAMRDCGWSVQPGDAATYMAELYPPSERESTMPPVSATPPASSRRAFLEASTVVDGRDAPPLTRRASSPGALPVLPRRTGTETSPAASVPLATAPTAIAAAAATPAGPAAATTVPTEARALDSDDELDAERTVIQDRPAFDDIVEETASGSIAPEATVASFVARQGAGIAIGPAAESPPTAAEPPPDETAPASHDATAHTGRSLHVPADSDWDFPPAEAALKRRDDVQARLETMAVTELPRPGRPLWLVLAFGMAAVAVLTLGVVLLLKHRRTVSAESEPVTVATEPAGATVYLDGEKRFGVTPLAMHGVTRGRAHTLLVTLDGHQPWQKKFTLSAGASLAERTFGLKLQAIAPTGMATLLVKVNEAGAEVYLDGELRGMVGDSALVVDRVATGKAHTLVIKRDGFEEQTVQLDGLSAGERRSVLVTLAPARANPNLRRGIKDAPGRKGSSKAPTEAPVSVPRNPLAPLRNDSLGEHLPQVPAKGAKKR